jgi:hypothetical protein
MADICFRTRFTCVVSTVALMLGASLPAIGKTPVRPYGGSCEAVVTVLTDPGVFPQELSIRLDCKLKHLGRTSGLILQTVTPTALSGSTVFANIENFTVYTAANGDTLESTQAGTGTIDLATGAVHFVLTETFTGGTGRFANASGSSDLEGDASIFTNIGFYTVVGQIQY